MAGHFRIRGLERRPFFGNRGESTIDYVVCDKNALYEIVDFKVHDINAFSDHVVVSFAMSTRFTWRECETNKNGSERVYDPQPAGKYTLVTNK